MTHSSVAGSRGLESFGGRGQGNTTFSGIYDTYSASRLKKTHVLKDSQDRVVVEPDEDDLEGLRRYKRQAHRTRNIIFFVLLLAMCAYGLFRFYTASCWKQFREVSIAEIEGMEFPIDPDGFEKIREECDG